MSVPLPSPEEILTIISNLPLKEALTYLAGAGLVKFGKDGFAKIKKVIQDKHNEGKYAFVPNKEEAQKLTQFSTESNYKKLSILIPNFEYIDIVRTGLLLSYYHQRNEKGDKEKVQAIRAQIHRRPNGSFLVKLSIISAESDSLTALLDYLYDLKTKENYTEKQLQEKLSERVLSWDSCSLLVDKTQTVGDVIANLLNNGTFLA